MSVKKKLFSAALAAGLVFGVASVSKATNGYYMIATGAKSLGMAGAVVANPQDASTIIQNPAGIAFLRNTTFDVGGAVFSPIRKLNGHDSDSKVYMIPSAGFAYNPMGCNCGTPHFVFGIGMYGVSGMGVDFSDSNLAGSTGALTKAWSNMAMMEMSVGGAYRVNDKLAIGFAPVFVYQSMGLEMNFNFGKPVSAMPTNQQQMMAQTEAGKFMGGYVQSKAPYKVSLDSATAYGVGFDFGIVYKVNDMIQLGLVYKSKRYMQKLKWNTTPDGGMIDDDEVKMRLDMPRQVAFGINFRPIEPLRIEADIRWINYKDVMDEVDIDGMRTIDQKTMKFVKQDTWNFHWKNQWVFAIGAEYQATKALTLRAGFNYAKSPIDDDDLNANVVAPAIVETHVTVGASYEFTKNLELSVAYAHAFEHKQSHKNKPGSLDYMMYGPETEAKMYQNTLALQLSYVF